MKWVADDVGVVNVPKNRKTIKCKISDRTFTKALIADSLLSLRPFITETSVTCCYEERAAGRINLGLFLSWKWVKTMPWRGTPLC